MKFDNAKIKKLLYKLASSNTFFKKLMEHNNIDTIQFKMLDSTLFQNIKYHGQYLEPWEANLDNQFLYYFLYSGVKVYIYIWVDKANNIMELEFMCMSECNDDTDFIEMALKSEIFTENIIDRTKKS